MRMTLILTAGLAAMTLAACQPPAETKTEAEAAADMAADTAATAPSESITPDGMTPADPDRPVGRTDPSAPPVQPPPILPTDPANPGSMTPTSPPPQ